MAVKLKSDLEKEKNIVKYIQLYSCTTNQPKNIESVELSPDSEDEIGDLVDPGLELVNSLKRANRAFDLFGQKHPEQLAVQGSNDPTWLRNYSVHQISEFDDITPCEFNFVTFWN